MEELINKNKIFNKNNKIHKWLSGPEVVQCGACLCFQSKILLPKCYLSHHPVCDQTPSVYLISDLIEQKYKWNGYASSMVWSKATKVVGWREDRFTREG